MNGVNEEKLVPVYSGDMWQAQLVKGLLDANAIVCAIKDDSTGILTSSYALAVGEVVVIVNEGDEAAARKVIEENTIPDSPETDK